jgi:uracil-DNA glycosylase
MTNCREYLLRELQLLRRVRAIVALGQIAFTAVLQSASAVGWQVRAPKPRFGHSVEARLTRSEGPPVRLLGSYHPSQQNTQTGRLTPRMLDRVLRRAVAIARAR